MSISNGSFEEGTGGQATDWTHTTISALVEYAPFDATPVDVGYDSFDWYDALIPEYEGIYVDIDPAIFESGPGQEPYEDFEEGWGATALITVLSEELAQFGSIPEQFDSFENGWGDFWWDLASAGSVTAIFNGAEPFPFDAFSWFGSLKREFTFLDLDNALFDNGLEPIDPYETFSAGDWPALVL